MDQQQKLPTYQTGVRLAELTSIGLGGEARYFAECTTADEIRATLADARHRGLRVQVLGGGSNCIFQDNGYNGIVLHLAARGITWTDEGETILASVKAGEPWDEFVTSCVSRGYSGVECLSGIPGSVGATPIQNVGAYGQEVKDTIAAVTALHRSTGEAVFFTTAECGFGYRESRFKTREKDQWIVIEVQFRLRKNGAPAIMYPELRRHLEAADVIEGTMQTQRQDDAAATLLRVRDAVIALRRKKSMVIDPRDPNSRSVGSFFMNPVIGDTEYAALTARWSRLHPNEKIPAYPAGARVKIPAAWLIEHAGFTKGYRGSGGAGISANHSLALVNYHGTTSDVLALAHEIQAGVHAVFGITLDREAIVVDG